MRKSLSSSSEIGRFLAVLVLSMTFLGLTRRTLTAATIRAASPAFADVSTAVASAASRDTVVVPAGTATWTNTLTITKGITLLGGGIDLTVIQYAGKGGSGTYAVRVTPDADTAQNDYPIRISGFTFVHLTNPYASILLSNSYYGNALTKVVVDHNKFRSSTYSGIDLRLAMFGVVHNNIFLDGSEPWRYLGEGIAQGKLVDGWVPGGAKAMYFEDNLVSISNSNSCMINSGGQGNRMVVRYNTWDLSGIDPYDKFAQAFDIHGNQGNNPGTGIGFEIYGNLRIGTQGRWLDARGGQVLFFFNRWICGKGTGSFYVWDEFNDDDPNFNATSAEGTSYPKTASGNIVQAVRDSYFWLNFGGAAGGTLSTSCIVLFDHYQRYPEITNSPLTFFENQNWWRQNVAAFDGTIAEIGSCGYFNGPQCTKSGIGVGTVAQMMAITPTAKGLGFWVTDQDYSTISNMVGQNPKTPIEGTLFRAVSDTQGGCKWEAYYTPYIYPHPLRQMSALGGRPLGLKDFK